MQVQHKHAGSQVAPYSGIKRAVVRGFFRPPFLEPRLVSASDEPHVLTVRSRSRALRPAGYYLPDSATERLSEYGGHRLAKPHSDRRGRWHPRSDAAWGRDDWALAQRFT